jgi:hypothetical protein
MIFFKKKKPSAPQPEPPAPKKVKPAIERPSLERPPAAQRAPEGRILTAEGWRRKMEKKARK